MLLWRSEGLEFEVSTPMIRDARRRRSAARTGVPWHVAQSSITTSVLLHTSSSNARSCFLYNQPTATHNNARVRLVTHLFMPSTLEAKLLLQVSALQSSSWSAKSIPRLCHRMCGSEWSTEWNSSRTMHRQGLFV